MINSFILIYNTNFDPKCHLCRLRTKPLICIVKNIQNIWIGPVSSYNLWSYDKLLSCPVIAILSIYSQAFYRKREDNIAYMHLFRRPNYRSAQMWLKPFYSKSKSFLKLKPIKGKLSCDIDVSIMAHYIIQGEELEKEQESLDFFYLVIWKTFSKLWQ